MMTRTWWRAAAVLVALVGSSVQGWAQLEEVAKLLASDRIGYDRFGFSVSLDGDTALVGSCGSPGARSTTGGVYVFVRSGGTWVEQAKLLASDGHFDDQFGWSVSLDGDTALVGAIGDDDRGADSGSVYVFVRSDGEWAEQAKLQSSLGDAGDLFGSSVSLSGDTALVAASGAQRAYVFVRSGGAWSFQAGLIASDGYGNNSFGWSVSLDEDTALVGARVGRGRSAYSGSVYVFVRAGGAWVLQSKLSANDGNDGDFFGCSVSLNGEAALVGAERDDARGTFSGSAYVFVRNGGAWLEQAKLLADDGADGDQFGNSVSLEGGTALIGAYQSDEQYFNSGSAYVFARSASTWTQQNKLLASDGKTHDQLGRSLSLGQGAALVGVPLADLVAGSAYIFDVSGSLTESRHVTFVDVSGDDGLDGVTANAATHDLSLWIDDGTGTLSESRVALDSADRAPVAIAAGDLDDDGFADDVAVACADSHSVARVLDLGSAPIASTQSCGGLQPTCVAIGDLDADGRDEVVVGREGKPFSGGAGLAVSWNGAAFAELAIPSGCATRVQKLALLDLDGDGDNDLVALAHGSPDELLLFAGDGAGALVFADAIPLATSGFASGLCAGDLDGDGDIDLAVALATLFPVPATELRILSHDGSSALQASAYTQSPPIATGGVLATDLACGELEDDSIPGFLSRRDLIVVHGGSGDARVFSGWDGAAFQSTRLLTVCQNPIAAAVGDLNGDGGDDVVIVNQGSSNLSVNLSVQPALAQIYGTGCPGTGALVPVLGASGVPLSGSASFTLELDQTRSFAPTLLLYSFGLDSLALGGGCSLYVELPAGSLLLFTDGGGTAALGLAVRPDPLLLGGDAYFQAAVFDPAGAFAATLAFSNGVRLQVGS